MKRLTPCMIRAAGRAASVSICVNPLTAREPTSKCGFTRSRHAPDDRQGLTELLALQTSVHNVSVRFAIGDGPTVTVFSRRVRDCVLAFRYMPANTLAYPKMGPSPNKAMHVESVRMMLVATATPGVLYASNKEATCLGNLKKSVTQEGRLHFGS
jgi:hypothetical protein